MMMVSYFFQFFFPIQCKFFPRERLKPARKFCFMLQIVVLSVFEKIDVSHNVTVKLQHLTLLVTESLLMYKLSKNTSPGIFLCIK